MTGIWSNNPQGTALINVYLDGSVLLSHGGCEIGQGLNTKMIQVCPLLVPIFRKKNIKLA